MRSSVIRTGTPEVSLYGTRQTLPVRSLAVAVVASLVGAVSVSPQPPAKVHLRIGMIAPSSGPDLAISSSVARGVRLGAAESNQTTALFGGDVRLFEATGAGRTAVAAAERLLSSRQVQILVGTSPGDAEALSRLAEARRVIFFNAASRAQSLRAACRRFSFHIEATDAMYATAARLGERDRRPQSGRLAPGDGRRIDSVVLWDPGLERFGASQINERYRDKYQTGMDGNAWAGWAAVKIGAEAALRAQSTNPSRLLAYLESPSTEFDGHKGWPLNFRPADHQLRQPLYIVVTTTTAGVPSQSYRDVPELRAVRDETPTEDTGTRPSDRALDALIGTADTPGCGRTNK